MRPGLSLVLLALACASAGPRLDLEPKKLAPGAARPAIGSAGSEQPLVLQRGEVVELHMAADGTAGERLATPSGDEQFVLILGSTRFEPSTAPFEYSVAVGPSGKAGPTRAVSTCSLASEPWADAPLPTDAPPTGKAPTEKSSRSINVPTAEGATAVAARALSVGGQAIVWADTTHTTTLDHSFVAQFRDDFERVIMPRERMLFGTESDIDGNGRVHLVFSPLTHQRAVAFFMGCDLLPALAGCASTNRGEYLYLTPPDVIKAPYNTPNAIKEILTHEVSHLLHFNRKVMRNELAGWPDSLYMIEGVGALAQDVSGYQAGNLYVTQAGLEGIDVFSLSDVLFDARRQDERHDGVLRGAAYLFVRYLYDRGGGDSVDGIEITNRGGPAFLRALLEAPESVAAALPKLGRARIEDVGMDFFTALAMSNRELIGGVAPSNACFAYLPTVKDPVTAKQRGASLFAAFHGQRMNGPRAGNARSADGKVQLGGVEYLTLDASPNSKDVAFALQTDPKTGPRVRVGRWK